MSTTIPWNPGSPRADAVRGSRFADAAAARRAVLLALPMLGSALDDASVGESGCLHVVIMDPALQVGDCPFEEAILYEHSLPDRSAWDADYAAYARQKAAASWRTGRATDQLQAREPHLLRAGETMLGGASVLDGIVVAVSGLNPWFDEAFGCCIAALLRAQARAGRETARGQAQR